MDHKGDLGAYQTLSSGDTNRTDDIELGPSEHKHDGGHFEECDDNNASSNLPFKHPISRIDPLKDRLLKRIGRYTVTMNALCLAGLIASTSIITWVWFGDVGQEMRRAFILKDILPQFVTLCSILIRLASGLQTATIVSLLASVLLESTTLGGVRLADAPGISIARYSNSGPVSSLWIFWNSVSPGRNWLFLIVMATAAVAIASQFTSTLLLWDIEPASFLDNPRDIDTGVGFRYDVWNKNNLSSLAFQGRNYWTAPLTTAPSFAEWTGSEYSEMEGVQDTGPSLRAFMPIQGAEARSKLVKFEGSASVFDSRVVCARPKVNFTYMQLFAEENMPNEWINGTFQHGIFTPEAQDLLQGLDRVKINRFNITLRYLPPGSVSFHQISSVGISNELAWKKSFSSSRPDAGRAFMVIHYDSVPGEIPPNGTRLVPGGGWGNHKYKVGENGVWVHFNEVYHPVGGMTHRMTVCYDAHITHWQHEYRNKQHETFRVSASRQSITEEPTISWDRDRLNYDTSAFSDRYMPLSMSTTKGSRFELDRRQIDDRLEQIRKMSKMAGVTEFSIKNIFNVKNKILIQEYWWPIYNANDTFSENLTGDQRNTLMQREFYDFINVVMWSPFKETRNGFKMRAICKTCETYDKRGFQSDLTTLSPALSSVFSDVLNATDGNVAKAWQALTTAVIGSAYYDFLPAFPTNETITITQSVNLNQPVRFRGYTIAMSIALAHLLILGLTLHLFHKHTRFSLIDSSWQSVSQLIAPETMPVLERSTMARDSEVSALEGDQPLLQADGGRESSGYMRAPASTRVILRRYEGGTVGVTTC